MPRNAPTSLLRSQVFRATTTNPHTKDFTHLLPFPRHWAKRTSHKDPHVNTVKPHERIKYWNIVPGDKIGLLGDRANTVHEVLSVNKLSNRVFLKNSASGDQKPDEQPAKSKSVAYARCRLFLGEHEYPSSANPADFIKRPVFAKRLGTSKPEWRDGRWQWDRFAVHTSPALPEDAGSENRLQVPWPDYAEPAKPPPTFYDTPGDTVREVTYTPPPLRSGSSVRSWPLAPAPEKEYIRRLWHDIPHDNTLLAELYLQPELARTDSRARRQERWQAQRTAERALLDEIIAAERKHGRHRSKAAAAGAAVVKWKAKLHEDKRVEKIRRAVQRGDVAKQERKAARKEKKEERRLERLRTLVLEEAPNQVIPTAAA